jgi:hypothetical protein
VKLIFPIVAFLLAVPLTAQISNRLLAFKAPDTNAPAADTPKQPVAPPPGSPRISNAALITGALFIPSTNTPSATLPVVKESDFLAENILEIAPQVFDFPPGTTVRKPLAASTVIAPERRPALDRRRPVRAIAKRPAPRVIRRPDPDLED